MGEGLTGVARGGGVDHAPGGSVQRTAGEVVDGLWLDGGFLGGRIGGGGETGQRLIDLAEIVAEAFEQPLRRGGRELDAVPRLRPLPHPSCEVRPLWNRDFDDETVLRHRLGQPRVRRQTLHLEDHDPAAAAPGSVGELFERLAGHRHEAVGRPHDGRAGGAGEQRHSGRLIEDIAGIGGTFTGELPPCPSPVGLIGAEAVAKQAEHVAGEERLVADQRDQRRCAERPVGRLLEDFEGAGSVGHGTALHDGAVSVRYGAVGRVRTPPRRPTTREVETVTGSGLVTAPTLPDASATSMRR